MRAIIVDDEPLMLKSFMRCSAEIPEFQVIAQFEDAERALAFAQENSFELALLDIKMPKMSGIELAIKLRERYPELLVVFISAYDEYVRDSNAIGGDDYIVKPYKKETIERMAKKMVLLSKRQQKEVYLSVKEKKGFASEFKEFISRGNVVDMAVGVVIGGAFTAIVTSLVNDVIMPVIGMLFGGVDFTSLRYVITPAIGDTPEAAICCAWQSP